MHGVTTMRELRVRDVMTGGALSVGMDARLWEVAEAVRHHKADLVAVVDREDVVVGVVGRATVERAEARLRPRATRLPRGRGWRSRRHEQRASELMNWPPLTVGAETSALEAAHLLVRHGVDRLPVVDDERRPIGSVTATDLLRIFLRPDAEVAEQVEHEVFGHALGLSLDTGDVRVHVEDGVVTLHGHVEHRSAAQDAVRLTAEVDGVAQVLDRLTFAIDDTAGAPAEAGRSPGARRATRP